LKKSLVFIFSIWIITALACNMPGESESSPESPAAIPDDDESLVLEVETGDPQPVQVEDEPEVVEEIPSQPVSIREGLGSLDSYVIVIEMLFSGPTAWDRSDVTVEMQYSDAQDAAYTHYKFISSTEENPEPEEVDSFMYRVGNDQCSGAEDEWDLTSMTPAEREMLDIFTEMQDLTPLIDNPTFMGAETMNGIQSNHFVFQVSGLGLTSGAEVTANEGEYWLAQDGRYIVRYSLVMETRGSPDVDILRQEILIDLTSINQPVSITMPAGCYAAGE
jgi:hypothetical protein